MNANDHALVKPLARRDEHAASLLEFPECIGHGLAIVLRDQHAVSALRQLAFVGAVLIKDVTHQPSASRDGQELALKADQPACGDAVFQSHTALVIRHHVQQVPLAKAQVLHDRTLVLLLHINRQHLVGFQPFTRRTGFHDDSRTRDRQFIPLAAHVLQENRQVQLTTARDQESVGV